MNSGWNAILQCETAGAVVQWECLRFVLPSAAVPTRISILSGDQPADPSALSLFKSVQARLQLIAGVPYRCGPARMFDCMASHEPSCEHVLCIVIGHLPVSPRFETVAKSWLNQSPGRSTVIPVLVNGLTPRQAFAGAGHPTLSQCNAVEMGGTSHAVADKILELALVGERPGVFISYLRSEASGAAESIFDGLTRAGYRVFLDRFCGTPGRRFPQELAEAMTGLGVVLLLETASLHKSKWTLWEAAFARRYRIGPLAINFQGAKELRGSMARHRFSSNAAASLMQSEVDASVQFVGRNLTRISLGRRAYYETLIELAAKSRGGSVKRLNIGAVEASDSMGNPKVRVVVSGGPAQLRHMRRLHDLASGTQTLLIAGEHQHLPALSHSDLLWLASSLSLEPVGSASLYRRVRKLI